MGGDSGVNDVRVSCNGIADIGGRMARVEEMKRRSVAEI